MMYRLGAESEIFGNPHFARAVVKVFHCVETLFGTAKWKEILHLLVDRNNASDPVLRNVVSFAEPLLISSRTPTKSKYIDMRLHEITSNMCERLFSTAGYPLNNPRKGIYPANLEMQSIFHVNDRLWGLADTNEIIK